LLVGIVRQKKFASCEWAFHLVVRHVTQDGEGDASGEEAGAGVDEAGDDRIPKGPFTRNMIFVSHRVI
jgi:hypothetical protein